MSGISNHCCKSAQIITLREEVESWSWVTFASELTTIGFRGTSLSSPHSLNWASRHTKELCNVTWGDMITLSLVSSCVIGEEKVLCPCAAVVLHDSGGYFLLPPAFSWCLQAAQKAALQSGPFLLSPDSQLRRKLSHHRAVFVAEVVISIKTIKCIHFFFFPSYWAVADGPSNSNRFRISLQHKL